MIYLFYETLMHFGYNCSKENEQKNVHSSTNNYLINVDIK